MAKAKTKAKTNAVRGVQSGLFGIDSYGDVEIKNQDNIPFVGVKIDSNRFGLEYDVHVDIGNGTLWIGCECRTIAEWQKASKRLVRLNGIPESDKLAYERIAALALQVIAESAEAIDVIKRAQEALQKTINKSLGKFSQAADATKRIGVAV